MTALPPKHRRPRVINGGKPLKTDLRLEGTGQARGLSTAYGTECDTSSSDHIEANRRIVEETRNKMREVNSRRRSPRKA